MAADVSLLSTVGLSDHSLHNLEHRAFQGLLAKLGATFAAKETPTFAMAAIGVNLTECQMRCPARQLDAALKLCRQYGFVEFQLAR